eukprot:1578844-Prymnesium_polylepis.1
MRTGGSCCRAKGRICTESERCERTAFTFSGMSGTCVRYLIHVNFSFSERCARGAFIHSLVRAVSAVSARRSLR